MLETPPTAPAPAEAAKVPVASPESPKPEASPPAPVDPAKAQQPPAVSDQSAKSEPPKPDNPDEKAARKFTRFDEIYARSKEQEARAILAERRAATVEKELSDLRSRFDTLSAEQQEFARVQAAVKTESLANLRQDAEEAKQQAAKSMADAFAEKVSTVIDRMPDFWDKFNAIPLTDHSADIVARSERGPEVAYYLASNPGEARRIAGLPANHQGYEIARIEARISPAAQVRRVSQAPAPVPTLSGGTSPATKSPDAMTFREYEAWRAAGGGKG